MILIDVTAHEFAWCLVVERSPRRYADRGYADDAFGELAPVARSRDGQAFMPYRFVPARRELIVRR